MSDEWEKYADRYRERMDTYRAYVDVWQRVSRSRSTFTSWATFTMAANAEPKQVRDYPGRVSLAEEIMKEAGYRVASQTVRGARQWSRE